MVIDKYKTFETVLTITNFSLVWNSITVSITDFHSEFGSLLRFNLSSPYKAFSSPTDTTRFLDGCLVTFQIHEVTNVWTLPEP